jgi:hypothetical protein
MKLKNNIFNNQIFKGIILGLLSLFILEFGTLAVIAGFNTERQLWISNIEDYEYILLIINLILAGLLGAGVAKQIKSIKILAYILNLIMLTVILVAYGCFLWIRFK